MSDHDDFEILALNEIENETHESSSGSVNKQVKSNSDWNAETLNDCDGHILPERHIQHDSDIEEIEEYEKEELLLASFDSDSVISHLSGVSLRRRSLEPSTPRRQCSHRSNYLSKSKSFNTDADDVNGLDLSPGNKAYTHVPNRTVDLHLNRLMFFAAICVLLMGLSNYIIWLRDASGFKSSSKLTLDQVVKIREWHQTISNCLVKDKSDEKQLYSEIDACFLNLSPLRQEVTRYFDQSKSLKDAMEAIQVHYWTTGEYKALTQFFGSEEAAKVFNTMNLPLLFKQLQSIGVLMDREQYKYHQAQSNKQKLAILEKENNELRAKLLEEEEDDKILANSLEEKISYLELENIRLKRRLNRERPYDSSSLKKLEVKISELNQENGDLKETLKQLQNQVGLTMEFSEENLTEPNKDKKFTTLSNSKNDGGENLRIDLLRQRINSMVQENEELKATIARLRWSNNQSESKEEAESDIGKQRIAMLKKHISLLETLLMSQRGAVLKYRKMYKDVIKKIEAFQHKKDSEHRQVDEMMKETMKEPEKELPNESSFAWAKASEIIDYLMETSYSKYVPVIASDALETVSDAVKDKLNSTLSTLARFKEKLWEKWDEIKELGMPNSLPFPEGQRALIEMIELQVSSLRKLQDVGSKFMSNNKPIEQKIDKFASKMAKILDNLDAKWSQMEQRLTKAILDFKDSPFQQRGSELSNWYLSRAESRRQFPIYPGRDNERLKSWIFRRARDREVLRMKGDHQAGEK